MRRLAAAGGAALCLFTLAGIIVRVQPAFGQTLPAPGWYQNAAGAIEGVSPIFKGVGLTIAWQNSYVYQSNNYWYAEVSYINTTSQIVSITCNDRANASKIKALVRNKGATIPSRSINAKETFCSRNPKYTASLNPGDIFYEWALFKTVPPNGTEISLDWNPYGHSPWAEPWSFGGDTNLPPEDCKPDLVLSRGICQTAEETMHEIPPEFFDVALCALEYYFPYLENKHTTLGQLRPAQKAKLLRIFDKAKKGSEYISRGIAADEIRTIILATEDPDDVSKYIELLLEFVGNGHCLKVLGVQYLWPLLERPPDLQANPK